MFFIWCNIACIGCDCLCRIYIYLNLPVICEGDTRLNKNIRTDLAMEARELWKESTDETTKLLGVKAYEEIYGSFKVTTVNILNEQGEKELSKPVGKYVTVELDGFIRREENAFSKAVMLIADELRDILNLEVTDTVLVAGLGNAAITPDAIGPEAISCVMVTRHLKERVPEYFAAFREVAAVQAGVLGTTGIESADLIAAVSGKMRPDAIIAVDALASCRMDRLCRTIQISDTGIVPGSGVGNRRIALNRKTLGVPVIAVGVPTVVDAASLAAEYTERAGIQGMSEAYFKQGEDMIVTPREIDKNVRDMAKLIGYGVNAALHDGLTIEDIDMFLS